jgi:hypothetical protein
VFGGGDGSMPHDSFDCRLWWRSNASFMGAVVVTQSGRVAGSGRGGREARKGREMHVD